MVLLIFELLPYRARHIGRASCARCSPQGGSADASVHDSYGDFESGVSPADVLDAIAGAFQPGQQFEAEHAVRREDASWLPSGAMPVDEIAERLGISLEAPAVVVVSRLPGIRHRGRMKTILGTVWGMPVGIETYDASRITTPAWQARR